MLLTEIAGVMPFKMGRPKAAPQEKQHHFRVHLRGGVSHDVLAASATDAEAHAKRRHPNARIVSTEQLTGL